MDFSQSIDYWIHVLLLLFGMGFFLIDISQKIFDYKMSVLVDTLTGNTKGASIMSKYFQEW